MTKLSVNINKIATIRNARGGQIPNVVEAAINIEKFGGQGITVHPRPDERHIRYDDVYELKKIIKTEFNIEGYPVKSFMDLVLSVKPEQVTLVPDPPGVLTSNAGWDVIKNKDFLKEVISEFKKNNIRVSLFVDTNINNIECSKKIEADRIELYTEPYALNYSKDKLIAIKPYAECSEIAHKLGLGINAGHDLSLENLKYFYLNMPFLDEVSIGHALISDALYYGLEKTVNMYLNCLRK